MRLPLFTSLLLVVACQGTVKLGDEDTSIGGDSDTDTGEDVVVSGDISVTPTEIDLGVVFLGQSAQGSVTITNVGDGEVDVSLTLLGGWATAYTLDSAVATPAPGEASTHTLTLTPTTWGDASISVLIEDAKSGGRVEVPVRALAQEDVDGDGYGSVGTGGEDCDDADTTINPGVPETWYDGVDSDCAGDDDYDQDGDGFRPPEHGGEDCVDTDAAAFPGAPDTWYDGVDSDCAGNDDYDQDADGYRSDAYGGDDCADTDPATNPGAANTWYDGVDTNCSGDDYDQDGDGYRSADHGGDDCLDTDASAYPGAAEVWYDGVDQDCAGDDDYDQDGDGVAYPTDCSDTDPTTTGPTTERLDGADNDCDGVIDDLDVDVIANGVLYGSTASQALGGAGSVAMDDDVTGDGEADVFVGSQVATSYLWVVDGRTAAGAAGLVTSYDTAQFSRVSAGSGYYYEIGWVNGPMGDVDGDGTNDLAFGGGFTYGSTWYGRSYLFEGGSSITGSVSSSAYTHQFYGSDESGSDGSYMVGLADMNGDGLDDVAIGSLSDSRDRDYYCGSVAVFNADDQLDDTSLAIDEGSDRVYGTDDNDYLGWSLVMGDITDDGYADVVASAPGYDGGASGGGAVFVIGGNLALSWDSEVDSAASLAIEGNTSSLALGSEPLSTPGDIDGSGTLDLGVASEASGDVWLFLDPGAGGTIDLSSADYNLSGTAGDMGSLLLMNSDLDGDGSPEVLVGNDGDDTAGADAGAVHVFTWSSSWPSALTASNAIATFYGSAAGAALGSGGNGGADLDGDGRDDVALGEAGNDTAASNAGAVWIVLGW